MNTDSFPQPRKSAISMIQGLTDKALFLRPGYHLSSVFVCVHLWGAFSLPGGYAPYEYYAVQQALAVFGQVAVVVQQGGHIHPSIARNFDAW